MFSDTEIIYIRWIGILEFYLVRYLIAMQEISNGPIIFWGDHDIYCAVGYRTGPEIDP